MARIRTIKPEVLEDERTAELGDSAFRLFTALIILADDFGNCRADERYLKAQVWWARRDSPKVAAILSELATAGLILVYRVREQMYVHLRGWEKHQRIDNRGKPRVPGPKDPESQDVSVNPTDSRGDSPRNSANLGETPLDHDHDHDHDQGRDQSGKPDAAALIAQAAISEINQIAKKGYRVDSDEVVKNSKAIAQANHTADEARLVVRSKRKWLADDKMRDQFKPSVLLRPSNFKRYLEDLQASGKHRSEPKQAAPRDDFELPELPWIPAKAVAS